MANDTTADDTGSWLAHSGDTVRAASDWLEGWRLDAIFAALLLWLHAGVTYDFRQHAEGLDFAEEGFLTVPHVVFYAAFVAISVTLAVVILANRAGGDSWIGAVPTGYRFALLGAFLFGLGGPVDFLWHTTFGFEEGVEALTSPTHLLLVTGAALFVTAPLRAAWGRGLDASLLRQLPALVASGLLLNTAAMFSGYGNPLLVPHAADAEVSGTIMGRGSETAAAGADGLSVTVAHGAAGMLVFAALVVGLAVTLARRFRLAPGAFTVVYGIVGVSLTFTGGTEELVPAMLAFGAVADVLYRLLDPSPDRSLRFRAFAAAIPTSMVTLYFATVHLVWGIAWSTHVYGGLVVAAGLVGLLVSYVAMPSVRHPDPVEGRGRRSGEVAGVE